MNIKKIRIKSSASKPIIIPCIVRDKKGVKYNYEYMYKKDDLRKEKIIMNAIKLMDIIIKKELNLDLHITKYNIIPTSLQSGFIEIISNSFTLYKIKKNKFTIQNIIIEKIQIQQLMK